MLEHPGVISRLSEEFKFFVRPPSVWKTQEIRMLLQHKATHTVDIFQADFGADSLNPTRFLAVNLPGLKTALQANQMRRPLLRPLHGKDDDGKYATARAKEYPAVLGRALAHAFAVDCDHHKRVESRPVSDETVRYLKSLVAPWVPYMDTEQEMGHDCLLFQSARACGPSWPT